TNIDGANPNGSLVLAANTLYGATSGGGNSGAGTLFSIMVWAVQPTITPLGTNVIISWPTNSSGYTVESTTNLASAIWSLNPSPPAVVNGEYTVTNPISGAQQFFRF